MELEQRKQFSIIVRKIVGNSIFIKFISYFSCVEKFEDDDKRGSNDHQKGGKRELINV